MQIIKQPINHEWHSVTPVNVATMIGTVNGMSKFGPICLVHNRVSGAGRSALQRHPQPGLKRVLTCVIVASEQHLLPGGS